MGNLRVAWLMQTFYSAKFCGSFAQGAALLVHGGLYAHKVDGPEMHTLSRLWIDSPIDVEKGAFVAVWRIIGITLPQGCKPP